jgi:hypothetical protein
MAWEAAMDVRDMKGNPGIWEKLSWADMSGKEKELWTIENYFPSCEKKETVPVYLQQH